MYVHCTCIVQQCLIIKFSFLAQVGSVVSPFVEYLSCKVLPCLSKISQQETRQELLQLLAEGCLYPVSEDTSAKCVEPIFNALIVSVMSL